MFVSRALLNGGLNQSIFRFLLRFLRDAGLLKYVNLSRCPPACKAASYDGLGFFEGVFTAR